jgi:hypothetical protein
LRRRLLIRLGLHEKVLVTEDNGHGKKHEGHGGAHIASTTTAGPLRLKIGILYFGQRILPIGWKRRPRGRRFLYGNGSRGKTRGAQPQSLAEQPGGTSWLNAGGTERLAARGTGSRPPGVKG